MSLNVLSDTCKKNWITRRDTLSMREKQIFLCLHHPHAPLLDHSTRNKRPSYAESGYTVLCVLIG